MPRPLDDLSNTPGIYYALAYIISSLMYVGLNRRRKPLLRNLLIELLLLLFLAIFMVMTNQMAGALFIPCMMVEVGLLYLSIYAAGDFDMKTAAYYTIRAFILGEFAASLEWQLFYYGINMWGLGFRTAWNVVFLVVIYGAIFAIMYLVERRYREGNLSIRINRREVTTAGFIAVMVYLLSNMSYVFQNTPFSTSFTQEIYIIRTVVDLSGVGILYAYHVQLQELYDKVEKQFLRNALHAQYDNFRIQEESVALVNQKYHDLKHQIEFLRADMDNEVKNAYLDQMERDIRHFEAQNHTGNSVLDIILTAKSMQCQNTGITFTVVADGEAMNFMEPMDISAMFGNALDNAIESVRKIEDPERRLIHLSVSRQKSFLNIRVENCYDGEITLKDGLPVTTKQDKRYHGYGVKSIKKIAEKYSGSVTVGLREGWFELRILMAMR